MIYADDTNSRAHTVAQTPFGVTLVITRSHTADCDRYPHSSPGILKLALWQWLPLHKLVNQQLHTCGNVRIAVIICRERGVINHNKGSCQGGHVVKRSIPLWKGAGVFTRTCAAFKSKLMSAFELKFLASDLQMFRVSNVNRNMADHDKLMFLWQVYTQLFNHCRQHIHPCGAIVLWLPTTASTWKQTQTLWLHKFRFCWIYLHACCDFPLTFFVLFLPFTAYTCVSFVHQSLCT